MVPFKKIAASGKQLLVTQQFSADGPGTIVRDFEALIDFVNERKILTESKQGNLPAEVLPELNALLAGPIAMALKRPLLRDYPNIGGLYVLLRVMDFVLLKGKRLSIDPARLALWRGLNPTEKYFALLEAWLFFAEGSVLGGAEPRPRPQFASNLVFLLSLSASSWKEFSEYCHLDAFDWAVSTWNTQLQMRLGLIEVEPRPQRGRQGAARGWLMEKARRTRWGNAVASTILEADLVDLKDLQWRMPELSEDVGFGSLRSVFRKHFPEWQTVYQPPHTNAQPGRYVFKARFCDYRVTEEVSCRLVVPGSSSLHQVARAVLRAFKFSDTDHLYEMSFRDRLGKSQIYSHPNDDTGPYANEVAVSDLRLSEKCVIRFLFDYGDAWELELQLNGIDPPGKARGPIEVSDLVGQPPDQYENEDDEDE